jgi:hypothetical protein
MKYSSLITVVSFMFLMACSSSGEGRKSPFTLTETEEGLELSENGNRVFFYQKKPKTLTGQYICNNYIHPLYDLNGDTLTEEFPPDHPYHRGIYWAWHQLYAGNTRLGDGWTNDSISQEVVNISSEMESNFVRLRLNVLWRSIVAEADKPFIEERTTITVHKLDADLRKIDFEIVLNGMVKGVQIGGSADQKGYGGFCVRLKLTDSLIFYSANGPVIPRELQIEAGPWMDFSGRFGTGSEISGITILCHPGMPDYHEPWILRQKGSMQNVVFPGSGRLDVPMDNPVVLRYRIIVHNGNAGNLNIPRLQQEYANMKTD